MLESHLSRKDKPVRAAVFPTVAEAENAVAALLAAGFGKEQILVVCSDAHKRELFSNVPTSAPAGGHAPQGAAIGAAIGGLTLATTAVITGGATLLAAGAVALLGGAVAGGFVGLMMSRGFDKEAADYYDQAVRQGKVLVSVEAHGESKATLLGVAERILANSGAAPVALTPG